MVLSFAPFKGTCVLILSSVLQWAWGLWMGLYRLAISFHRSYTLFFIDNKPKKMDVKVLLFYFHIYTLYLLNPVMAAQRYCGTTLADALRIVCADRGYYTQNGAYSPMIPRQRASSFLTTDSENHPRRLRRRTGQIVTECCENSCDREILETYCNPHVTPTLALEPFVTSLKTKSPPSEPGTVSGDADGFAMTDNALREDYEHPTKEGPLTSGEPTPTENRISNGLRAPSNSSSAELLTRALNSTRISSTEGANTQGAHLAESSDQQSSLEDVNSESEAPTRATGNERRKPSRRPKTKPPKRNRKTSKERRERKRKKEKERRERQQRTNSKKHRSEERGGGGSNLSPTQGGAQSNSDQSRNNRGKANESQRHTNGAGQEMDRIEKLARKLQNLPPLQDLGRSLASDID